MAGLLTALRFVDEVVVAHAAGLLQRFSPLLFSTSPDDGANYGFWFLSPRQHVYEFLGLNAVFLTSLPFIYAVAKRRVHAVRAARSRSNSISGEQLLASAQRQMHHLQSHLASQIDHAKDAVSAGMEHARDAVTARVEEAREVVTARVEEAREVVTARVEEAREVVTARVEEARDAAHHLRQRIDAEARSQLDGALRSIDPSRPPSRRSGDDTRPPTLPWIWRAGVPLALLSSSWLITLQQKYAEGAGALWFMLQPCHMSAGLLAVLLATPRSWRARDLLFNVFFPMQWGAVLALAQPDLRTHTTALHVANFVAEHVLILAVPVYLARVREYRVLRGARLATAALAFLAVALYHSALLATLGVFSGVNLNYVLAPPPGPLEHLGRFYRLAMFAACAVLTLAMRFVVFEAALKVAHWFPPQVLRRAWARVFARRRSAGEKPKTE
ncbi:hypothetical protein H9P43_008673 [Blastocladiella emersonii ATCC 22665]|nr:hypothetical protein H9P43_008673 [Blastocladiella emersonii ATCC 22665]